MKVIGITGGIGAGKSEVLKFLADNYKCEIIMADDVAKGLYYKGSKAYHMITMLFGDDILSSDASIDKKKLADIIKLAMIRVSRALKEQNLKSRLILQVHDELLVETAVDEIDIVKDILTKGMKEAASLRVPLEIDIKQGNNWLEAH